MEFGNGYFFQNVMKFENFKFGFANDMLFDHLNK